MLRFGSKFKVRNLHNVRIPKHLKDVIKVGTVMTLEKYDPHTPTDPAPFQCTVSEGFFDKHIVCFDISEIAELLPLALFDAVVRKYNNEYAEDPARREYLQCN